VSLHLIDLRLVREREGVGGSCACSFGNVSSDRVECVLGDS
jgi:hypothetical protein